MTAVPPAAAPRNGPTRRLLVTRPVADAERFADALRARGIEAVIAPVLSIEIDQDAAPDVDTATALAVTSVNGLRAFASLSPRRDLPVFAVGARTAAAAQAAGFTVAATGDGGVEDLAAVIAGAGLPDGAHLYHPCGRDRAGDLPGLLVARGITCRQESLYAAEKAEQLPEAAADSLTAGTVDGAAFFSPRSARHFATLVKRAGLADRCVLLTAFCLSPSVAAAAAELEWRQIMAAAAPSADALLEVISANGARPQQP